MGLFSTLQQATASTDKNASSSSSSKVSSSSSSSLAVPTLIQLSTAQQSPIALPKPEKTTSNKGKTTTPTAAMPSWAALTYQTCILDTTSPGVDLGVWNATLLHKDFLMPPTNNNNANPVRKLVLTIDLRASDPASIEPQITKMQQALVRYWIQHPPTENDSTKAEEVVRGGEEENAPTNPDNDDDDELMTTTLNETTSLLQLKTVQFGLAQDDTEHTTTTSSTSTTTDEHDAHTKMAIILCAILPSSSINKKSSTTDNKKDDDDDDEDDASYARQQTQALLQYHLRKYAQQLNCALVYVHDNNDDKDTHTDTDNNNPLASGSVTIAQLAILWRAFALGRPIWKEAATLLELPAEMTETAESTTDPVTNSTTTSLIVYGPDNYQEDLLDTVVLRNAQYPGKWDAAKESLWKILPYDDTDTAATTESNTTNHHHDTVGDQSWLTELGQSMDVVVVADDAAGKADPLATPARTPGTKKKPSKKTAEPATPGDAAAFFESLLK